MLVPGSLQGQECLLWASFSGWHSATLNSQSSEQQNKVNWVQPQCCCQCSIVGCDVAPVLVSLLGLQAFELQQQSHLDVAPEARGPS